jgi:hypothetical protein
MNHKKKQAKEDLRRRQCGSTGTECDLIAALDRNSDITSFLVIVIKHSDLELIHRDHVAAAVQRNLEDRTTDIIWK